MNVQRCVMAALFALALGGGSALAAGSGLPVYPGAAAEPRPDSVLKECGHQVTETHYTIANISPNVVMNWYAQRIPGAVRVAISATPDVKVQGVYDAGGTRAVSLFGDHLTLLTYSPPLGTAGVNVLRRATAGDKGALNQLAHCSSH